MADQHRGDDAADHAPKPNAPRDVPPVPDKQDAPNYKTKVDGGRAEPVETLNSANDE